MPTTLCRHWRMRVPAAAFALALLLLDPCRGRAQAVSVGINVGVPVNSLAAATDGEVAATSPYTFGPSLRISLPRGFGFDAEFLYKRISFGFAADPLRAGVHRVELPLLLRYTLPGLPVRPFVHAGVSFNRVLAVGGASVCEQTALGEAVYCIAGRPAAVLRHQQTHGLVLGAGLDLRWRRVRLAPEIRFTRWVDRNFGTHDTPLRSSLTQAELLLGLRF